MISRKTLQALLKTRQSPAISLFMPTHPVGPEMRKDAIRLKNLLSEAERRIADKALFERIAAPLLPLAEAREEPWREMEAGLATFLTVDDATLLKLPQRVEEDLFIADRFVIRPLIPYLPDGRHFYLLAANQKMSTLYEGNADGLWTVREEAFEESLPSILERTELPGEVGFHTAGPSSAYHAAGEAREDYMKRALSRYAMGIAKVVDGLLAAETDPLILAAEPALLGLLREWIHYRGLMDEAIPKDPEGLDKDRLHAAGLESLAPQREARIAQALDRFHAHDCEKTAVEAQAVLRAACEGAVTQLLLAEGGELWGRFDPASGVARFDPARREDSDDLVDLAIHGTLAQGGEVLVIPAARMPREAVMAALLRY